uniref:Uncharacterized protein n=1 Tax=Trypanosoma vivax (strain Y486) TaxID=1055687 RepID=G0TWZ6_TRYVY|nr:conserved hypothetical protein [Trypanosoma vivax Y486]
MENALILSFIRLVRDGRLPARVCTSFVWGDMHMQDSGFHPEDVEKLPSGGCSATHVALIVYIKNVLVEIWRFQDLRTPNADDSGNSNGSSVLTEKQETSLSTVVRVIFAYLRVHELYAEIMEASADDISIKLVLSMDGVPQLKSETSSRKTWSVEGLVTVEMEYDPLWRLHTIPTPKSIPARRTGVETNATPHITIADGSAEPRSVISPLEEHESAATGLSLPTPIFAPASFPSSVGSGRLSYSLNPIKNSPFRLESCPQQSILPHTESPPFFKPLPQRAAAAAILANGAVTPFTQRHTHAFTPIFASDETNPLSDSEDDVSNPSNQLSRLLSICERSSLRSATVDMREVLKKLEGTML